jgi:F-type H+-transporting ATPase subunit delta
MADFEAIARPYAQAVFELAQESGSLDVWARVLEAGSDIAVNDDLIRLLHAPGAVTGEIAAVIAEICSRAVPDAPADQMKNFIRLLAENGRVLALPAIRERFDALKAEVENTVDVVLTAAKPVDESHQARIVEALKKRFGREVNLQFNLDENLIGGARLQADDLVIDGSVRTGLEKLSSALVH